MQFMHAFANSCTFFAFFFKMRVYDKYGGVFKNCCLGLLLSMLHPKTQFT